MALAFEGDSPHDRIRLRISSTGTKAMASGFRTLKLVIEPGGAVALAALLSGKLEVTGKTVAVVLSGGNVDPATFAAAIS